jgi:hypothetical protein
MITNTRYALVSLKSFGDMTIATRAIRTLYEEDARNIVLWIGSHHVDIWQALQPDCATEILILKYTGVPAFYDIKHMGVGKATLSFVNAFQAIQSHKSNVDVLIFDVLSWREKILAGSFQSIALDNREQNIYKNYRETFLQMFGRIRDEVVQPGVGKTILILPHGRNSFRNIPSDLIDQMAKVCILHGFEPTLYMLEGETPIPCKIPIIMHSKRSFSDLRKAIEQSCAVISADSLTTHFATYMEMPVFVASPYNKTLYWLPPYSDEHQFWGLFTEPLKMMDSLERFLLSLR